MSQLDQLDVILRGSAEVISRNELEAKLKTRRPLRVKYGADPSAPDLHLGHTVVLRKLRQLQDLGHMVQFLIGDFTAMIGDPTGRSATRPPLTPEQIQENARTYQEQVFRILLPERTEIVFNSRWCAPMTFPDVIRLASRTTVARILERDDFQKRYGEGRPIGLHELLYPLIQGHDSVVLQSDVELCGTDQMFNCLVARALQQDAGQEPEVILAMPLLEGLDGVQKMSKSLGNYIGVTDPPGTMYGKAMSIPDTLMIKYYELLTPLSAGEVEDLRRRLERGAMHPRDAKANLARQLVAQYYGKEAAEQAAIEFDQVFKEHALPDDMPEKVLSTADRSNGRMWIIPLLYEVGLVGSKGEAQRMVRQGGVQIDQVKISDPAQDIELRDGMVIQVGKRRFVRIRLN